MSFIYLLFIFFYLNTIGFTYKSSEISVLSFYKGENQTLQSLYKSPFQHSAATIEDITVDDGSIWTLIHNQGFFFGLKSTQGKLKDYFSVVDKSVVFNEFSVVDEPTSYKTDFRAFNKKLEGKGIISFNFKEDLPPALANSALLNKPTVVPLNTIKRIRLPCQEFFGVYELKKESNLENGLLNFFKFLNNSDVFDKEFLRQVISRTPLKEVQAEEVQVEEIQQKDVEILASSPEETKNIQKYSRTDSDSSTSFIRIKSTDCLIEAPEIFKNAKPTFNHKFSLEKFLIKKTQTLKNLLMKNKKSSYLYKKTNKNLYNKLKNLIYK